MQYALLTICRIKLLQSKRGNGTSNVPNADTAGGVVIPFPTRESRKGSTLSVNPATPCNTHSSRQMTLGKGGERSLAANARRDDISTPATESVIRKASVRQSLAQPLKSAPEKTVPTFRRSDAEARHYFTAFHGCAGCGGMPIVRVFNHEQHVKISHFANCPLHHAFLIRHPAAREWYRV